jgi:hypothetical protein
MKFQDQPFPRKTSSIGSVKKKEGVLQAEQTHLIQPAEVHEKFYSFDCASELSSSHIKIKNEIIQWFRDNDKSFVGCGSSHSTTLQWLNMGRSLFDKGTSPISLTYEPLLSPPLTSIVVFFGRPTHFTLKLSEKRESDSRCLEFCLSFMFVL